MIDLPKHKMTADEFLAWAEDLPSEAGKFELWDGKFVFKCGPVAPRTPRSRSLGRRRAPRTSRCTTPLGVRAYPVSAVDGPMVRLSLDSVAQPDVLVYCGPKAPRGAQDVPNPLILVEVLSPSTEKRDHGVKREGYFTLASLHHYLIIDPDRARLIHHKRGARGTFEPHIVTGPRLQLDPPGLDVDLTEVLAG